MPAWPRGRPHRRSRISCTASMGQNCSLVALGKAAGAMAQGAIDALGGTLLDGLVISKPGHLDRPAFEAGD